MMGIVAVLVLLMGVKLPNPKSLHNPLYSL